jgi:hypothetical protein
LAIPLSNAFIYVEPIYLEAKQESSESTSPGPSQPGRLRKPQGRQTRSSLQGDQSRTAALPELKRVIVAFRNRVVMAEDLDSALRLAVAGEMSAQEVAAPMTHETRETSQLGALALEHFNNAKRYLREGDWAGYGRELEQLENILREMSAVPEEMQ